MATDKAPFAWRWARGLGDEREVHGGWGMPAEPGCYAVYFDGRLVYIGQSENIRKRFGLHNIRRGYCGGYLTPWGQFSEVESVRVKYKPGRRYGEWAMRELRLIRRLQPELNCRGAKRKQCREGKQTRWLERAMEHRFEETANA